MPRRMKRCGRIRYGQEDCRTLGAAAALTTLGATQANATPAVDQSPTIARSYAELLDPVPNAAAQLKADDAAQANPGLTLAEYVYVYRRHHHHHHHHIITAATIGCYRRSSSAIRRGTIITTIIITTIAGTNTK